MYLQKEDDWDLKIYNRSRELVLIASLIETLKILIALILSMN